LTFYFGNRRRRAQKAPETGGWYYRIKILKPIRHFSLLDAGFIRGDGFCELSKKKEGRGFRTRPPFFAYEF